MIINYELVLFVYCPVLLLLLIAKFRDRFEPRNEALKSCNWSLFPAIIALFFILSGEVIRSLWYVKLIPILKKVPYNASNWEIFSFFYISITLILLYIYLNYVHKISIVKAFHLKLSQIPFILKFCAVLTIINIFCLRFLDFNLLLNPKISEIGYIKSLDIKQVALFFLVTIVLAPILEESLFRGLLYSPLYRKVGRYLAIILSSLIWAVGHFQPLLPSVGIFMTGILLAWLYDRSGSLIHPIIFHIFINSWIVFY